MTSSLFQIDLIQPGDLNPLAFSFWNEFTPRNMVSSAAVRLENVDTGPWKFTWFVESCPSLETLCADISLSAALADAEDLIGVMPAFEITPVPDINWLQSSYRSFPPFSVGRFFLYGLHAIDTPVPQGQIGILIDAVTAFGSGEHPTTKGCLMLMEESAAKGNVPQKIMDLGTGSGILAIAAWKLWGAPVMAVDIERESVRVACHYRDLNHVPSGPRGMTGKQASTPAVKTIRAAGPYDLIIANILAAPLKTLAGDIAATAPNHQSTLILSGLLERQMPEVIAAYTPYGYHLTDQKIIGEWAAIRLDRS